MKKRIKTYIAKIYIDNKEEEVKVYKNNLYNINFYGLNYVIEDRKYGDYFVISKRRYDEKQVNISHRIVKILEDYQIKTLLFKKV